MIAVVALVVAFASLFVNLPDPWIDAMLSRVRGFVRARQARSGEVDR